MVEQSVIIPEKHYRGIPLNGMDELKAALTYFMHGGTRGSAATGQELPGLAFVMKTMIEAGNDHPFLTRMFGEMEQALKSRGRFDRSYDYDGVGPFFKTTVEVHDLNDKSWWPFGRREVGLYLLEMSAAYVGTKVEDGLAEALGVEQGLNFVSVDVPLPAEGESFQIDCDQLLIPVYQMLDNINITRLTGEELAQEFMPQGDTSGCGFAVICEREEYKVSLGIPRDSAESPYRTDIKYGVEGSTFTGPRTHSYDDETQLNPLVAKLNISSTNLWRGQSYARMPVLDQAIRQEMLEIADRLSTVYQT